MSKITNDGLTQSGAGCFIYVAHTTTVGVKGLTANWRYCFILGDLLPKMEQLVWCFLIKFSATCLRV